MPASEGGCCGPGQACSRADCSGSPDALRRKGYVSAQEKLYGQYPGARAIHQKEEAEWLRQINPTLDELDEDHQKAKDAWLRMVQADIQKGIVYVTPTKEKKMDGTTKAVIWLVLIVLLMCGGIFGLGAWSFIELIQWITSK